jgi:hypothetical protein
MKEVNLKLTEQKIEPKTVYVPWIFIQTPYIIISDSKGCRKVWIKNKRKILMWFLYKMTGSKHIARIYNKMK